MKKKTLLKRICSFVLAGILAFPVMGVTAQAEGEGYVSTDTYVLNYADTYPGPAYQYLARYKPYAYWLHTKGTRTPIIFNLYNTCKDEVLPVYCMESGVTTKEKWTYRRMNLEDSIYSKGSSGLIRSVMMNGFPHVSAEQMGLAAGIEDLTVSEAITATQLAVWESAYGDLFKVTDFVNTTIEQSWNPGKIDKFDICNAEFVGVSAEEWAERKAEGHSAAEARIKAAYEYLVNLEPTDPIEISVSNAAFEEWSVPQVVKNNDGTYDVSVSVTVDVLMKDGDELTLSAVMGDGTYYTSEELKSGINSKTLIIKNVPADVAHGKVKLAIDGVQTVSDVFMFDAEGNRGGSQTLVGIYGEQLPVHAEVIAEPERIVEFYKTTMIPKGTNGDGTTAYVPYPLANITFDMFFVKSLDDYLANPNELPEKIDMSKFGYNKKFPSYTLTTDEDGVASVSLTKQNLPDGVYVVAERANPAIEKPVAPFYVMIPATNGEGTGWEYKVTIEPKNDVIDGPEIRKDVIEIEHQDKIGEEEQRASVDAGVPFTWIVRSDVPADIADAKSYVITDTLDYRLTYAENLVVKVEEITAEADNSVSSGDVLVKGKDYTLETTEKSVSVSGNDTQESTREIKVALTDIGMDQIARLVGNNAKKYEIRVYFDTVIDEDVAGFMGENIENKATLDYTNSVNFEFDKESDNPRVYTCGINLKKYDAKDNEKLLAGATFKVARKATAEEIADVNVETSTLVIGRGESAEVVYVDFYNNQALAGERVDFVVTDDKGAATIYGLAEIFEADPEDEEKDGDGIKTADYYLVETKAPEGYNLLSYPIKVELNEVSHTEANILGVANSNRFELPSTGGIGTTIFTLAGASLSLGSGAVLAGKKRKEETEE